MALKLIIKAKAHMSEVQGNMSQVQRKRHYSERKHVSG
jgi:hypothetical protein